MAHLVRTNQGLYVRNSDGLRLFRAAPQVSRRLQHLKYISDSTLGLPVLAALLFDSSDPEFDFTRALIGCRVGRFYLQLRYESKHGTSSLMLLIS